MVHGFAVFYPQRPLYHYCLLNFYKNNKKTKNYIRVYPVNRQPGGEHRTYIDRVSELFMFGIYPYTVVIDKQKEAMKLAGVDYTYSSLYDLTYVAARRMRRN